MNRIYRTGQIRMATEDILDPKQVADAVYSAIGTAATSLRPDFLSAIRSARDTLSTNPGRRRAESVLSSIIENASVASEGHLPLCQDTGTVWVCLEIGEGLSIPANIFKDVNSAVAQAYKDNALRMSVVRDALFDRANTGDNTPAFCEIKTVPGDRATLHVLLKGGGSDNASRVVMLPPGAGREGIIQEITRCVEEKAANACPPLLLGIGVGATFDKVASMAKHALLRPIGSSAQSNDAAVFESEVLEAVNALDIGPGALGGYPTCIGVHLETAPCHIAALPLAINMGCCAMRSATVELL